MFPLPWIKCPTLKPLPDWGGNISQLCRKSRMTPRLFNSILEIPGEWPSDLKAVSSLFLPQHLSISNANIQVDASFMQTLWNVHPTCSGSSIEEGVLSLCMRPSACPSVLCCPYWHFLLLPSSHVNVLTHSEHDLSSPEFLSLMLVWIIFCPDFWWHEHSWNYFLILGVHYYFSTRCI